MCPRIGVVFFALAIAACGGPKAPLGSSSGPSGATSTGAPSGSSSSSAGTTGQGGSTSAGGTSGSSSTTGTSSGSTSGGTGTSSGSTSASTGTAGTSGGTSGGCLTDGRGGLDARGCLTDADCACPFHCQLGSCAQSCTASADCLGAIQSCQSGLCTDNTCSAFNTVCDASDAGDGTCTGTACEQNGTASPDGACDPSATRQTPQALCPAGYFCLDVGLTGTMGVCRALCDPQLGVDAGCLPGEGCASANPSFGIPSQGYCVPTGDGGCANQVTSTNTEFNPCIVNADCACPEICSDGGVCRFPCATSTDCAEAFESCVNGICDLVFCGVLPDGGTSGVVDGICTTEGTDAGICVPAGVHTTGVCYRPGSSTTGCVVEPPSWDPADACTDGYICLSALPDGGICGAICVPDSGTPGCPNGWTCSPYQFEQLDYLDGVCVPAGDGGCAVLPPSPPPEVGQPPNPCIASSNCPCPAVCSSLDGGGYCLIPCQSTGDCPDVTTSCQGGYCVTNSCETLGEVCDAGGAGDGLCVPTIWAPKVCVQSGTATQACDHNATRADPTGLCATPLFCGYVDGGSCEPVCDPMADAGTCTGTDICVTLPFVNGGLGICSPCVDVQGTCLDSSQCCAGTCDLSYGTCL
jgi:hypothetical protein